MGLDFPRKRKTCRGRSPLPPAPEAPNRRAPASGPTALKRWVKLSGTACYPAFAGKLDKLNYPSLQRVRTTSLWEICTRYIIIDPVLRSLEWDPSDPSRCRIEYDVPVGRRVDYALLGPDGHPLILVEAKRLDRSCRKSFSSHDVELKRVEELAEGWRRGRSQLRHYLDGVDTASAGVLTNGEEWLFVEWAGDVPPAPRQVAPALLLAPPILDRRR